MKKVLALLIFVYMTFFAGLALAHHSAAIFDSTKLVILKGTTLKFTNMNPHAWISLDAKVNGAGESERWDVETTAPMQLVAMGITSQTLKPGDKVTIAIRPLRDGRARALWSSSLQPTEWLMAPIRATSGWISQH